MLWRQLDRWDYTNLDVPSGTPPPYTLYTFLTLGEAFQVFLVIMGIHTLAILIAKIASSREFRNKGNILEKFIHVIQSLRKVFQKTKKVYFSKVLNPTPYVGKWVVIPHPKEKILSF